MLTLCFALGAALCGLLMLLAVYVPITLCGNVQGKAEPSGAWAVACGLGLGPVAFSAVAGAAAKPFLTCHVFGKQLVRVPLSRRVRRHRTRGDSAAPGSHRESETKAPPSRVERAVVALFRTLDPFEMLLSWWDEDRIFRVRSLVVDIEYSFRDVALTGRLLAALYVLSAVVPPVCEIRQTPSWQSEDRVSLAADGQFRIWPGRLLISLARSVLKHRSQARQSARLAKQATHST